VKTRSAGIWGGAFVLVFALMLLYVWKGWRARVLAAQLEALKTEQRRLLDAQDKLRTQAVSLSNVERIKDIATHKLGLVEPPLTPVDVAPVAPLGPADSVAKTKATGTELWQSGAASAPSERRGDR